MKFQPGKSGNPNGSRRPLKFLQALEKAIAADGGVKFRKAAEMLLKCASEGEPWALTMLADRIDGKADQVVTFRREIDNLSREEILVRIGEIRGRAATATILDSDGREGEVAELRRLS